MHTELNNFTPPPVISTYPHLKRSHAGGCVILFTGPKTGVVLISGMQTKYEVGQQVTDLHENVYVTLPVTAVVSLSNAGLI